MNQHCKKGDQRDEAIAWKNKQPSREIDAVELVALRKLGRMNNVKSWRSAGKSAV